jgi:mannosyltransferase OCH1-like enzyme
VDILDDQYIRLRYGMLSSLSSSIGGMTDVSYRIPKVCHQTWVTNQRLAIPEGVLEIMDENKRRNPDVDFILWNDTQVDAFIKREFSKDTYSAFKSLNPRVGALKADFFRYCVVYKLGGLYLDVKSSIKVPQVFGNIIRPEDECILDINRVNKMPYRQAWNIGSYEQWFLAYEPNHPYLKAMIEKLTITINQRVEIYAANTFKEKVLRLTGPDAYSSAIHEAIIIHSKRHREISYFTWLRYRSNRVNIYPSAHMQHYSDMPITTSLYAD